MLDPTDLFDGWIGEEVTARVLAPGGPPTTSAEEGKGGPIAYPLGVGTNGGVLQGFDERGIVVDSGNRVTNTEELHFIPFSAILDLKLLRQPPD
jgi:hypothetical protein